MEKLKTSHFLTFLFLFVCAGDFAFAQVAEMREANTLFSSGKFREAIPVYQQVLANVNDKEARLKLANCFRLTKQYTKAIEHYEQILKSGLRSYEHFWQYGECQMHEGKYAEAIGNFNKYLRFDPVHDKSLIWRETCDNIQQIISLEPNYEALLLPVNSPRADFAPSFYTNGLLFTSSRVDRMMLNKEGEEPQGILDLYFTEIRGKDNRVRYFKPRLLTGALNVQYHEGNSSYSPSDERIAFSRHNFISGCSRIRDGGGSLLGIYFSSVDDLGWTSLEPFPFNSDSFSLTQPFISSDGQSLLYASDQAGGQGGFDLYLSRYNGDEWTKPVNLGPTINSSGDEFFPFLHEDGTLYFSSDGHKGKGKLDVFKSTFENSWSKPEALPSPINSAFDDFSLILTPDQRQGYFASDRPGGVGEDDVYTFLLKEPYLECKEETEDNYCFTFRETGIHDVPIHGFVYKWILEDGQIQYGEEIQHCFPGPGDYEIRLSIVDTTYNLEISNTPYPIKLKKTSQARIAAPAETIQGEKINLSGSHSYLEDMSILGYKWDMGDGTLLSGENVEHTYAQPGVYEISLKIVGANPNFTELGKSCTLQTIQVE